jgi:Ca-activated chloride channel family protein
VDNREELWGALENAEFTRRDDALGERWKDSGPWLVLLLLPLALVGFRRGLFFAAPLVLANLTMFPQTAEAGWWDDLWLRKDQQAHRALQAEDAPAAAALAVDPALSGEAWYRAGEFANAADAWRAVNTADGHYNRGNALAQKGELDAAIAAYGRALELEPGMPDAVHNRAVVEQMKEQQEQEQESGQGETGEGESPDEQKDGAENEQSQDQDGEEGDTQQGDQESEQSESENQEGGEQQQTDLAETWSEEDAQAMEQWLRRIPDDPGGLLRRKFRNQHQRRGAPEDESESW